MARQILRLYESILNVQATRHHGRWIATGDLGVDNPIGHGASPKAALDDWRFRMNRILRRRNAYYLNSAGREGRANYLRKPG